jgi:hypothetical protein
MSNKKSDDYFKASENARASANAKLNALDEQINTLNELAKGSENLSKAIREATDPVEKEKLKLALEQYNANIVRPTAIKALELEKSSTEDFINALDLRELARKTATPPEMPNLPDLPGTIPDLASQNPGDPTAYSNPFPEYGPNKPAGAPELIPTVQQPVISTVKSRSTVTTPDQTQPETILITKTLDEPQAPTSEPVENTAGVQTFAVRPQATLPTTTIPDESSVVRISNPTAEQIAFIEANSAVVQPQQTIAQTLSSTSNPIRQAQKTAEPYAQSQTTDSRISSTASIADLYAQSQATDTRIVQENSSLQSKQRDTITVQDARQRQRTTDLRFRISLAPDANYMYKIATPEDVLYPLNKTNGVIFPYTPQITLNYAASYEPTDVTHSNYRLFNYRSSGVENISIIADFTAQDTTEANYLLAVMHFFKSVTKMFYGNDENPSNGAPPPLCYLTGFGKYAFNMHAVAITTFSFTYPNDVDYINAGVGTIQGQQLTDYTRALTNQPSFLNRISALKRSGLGQGGVTSRVPFTTVQNYDNITRVPTKITLTLSAIPVVTRNNVSNVFSLKDYSTGKLMQRGFW